MREKEINAPTTPEPQGDLPTRNELIRDEVEMMEIVHGVQNGTYSAERIEGRFINVYDDHGERKLSTTIDDYERIEKNLLKAKLRREFSQDQKTLKTDN